MTWTQEQIDHMARLRRDDRGEACQGPRLILAHGVEWVVATDARAVIALNRSLFNGTPSNFPRLEEASNAKPLIEVMQTVITNGTHEPLKKLRAWAGDPAASPRPGRVKGTIIDRSLLSRIIAPLPGPTVIVGSGRYGDVTYVTVQGEGWKSLVVSFQVLDRVADIPRYEDFDY